MAVLEPSQTVAQIPGMTSIIVGISNTPQRLTSPLPASHATYRRIAKHPVVAMARALRVAPIVASTWSVEADDGVSDEQVEFVSKQTIGRRADWLAPMLLAGIDYGFYTAELVWGYDPETNRITLARAKQLIPDLLQLMILPTGEFAGIAQPNMVIVPVDRSLLLSFRAEGDQHYGSSQLENVRTVYNSWVEVSEVAETYDRRFSSPIYDLAYPVDTDGTTRNADAAVNLLNGLAAGSSIAHPRLMSEYLDTLANPGVNLKDGAGFSLTMLEDKGSRQPQMLIRMEHLEKLMSRGLIVPERTMLEATTAGSRADSEGQNDLALEDRQAEHDWVTRRINEQVVDRLLAYNFGEKARGTVRLVAGSLSGQQQAFFKRIYTAMIANPSVLSRIDLDSLMDEVAMPKSESVVQPIAEPAAKPEPTTGATDTAEPPPADEPAKPAQ